MQREAQGACMDDAAALRRDRDRFVKLAFCRADLLFELDTDYTVVFAAGVTEPLFGKSPDAMAGETFLSLLCEAHRNYAKGLLEAGGRNGRIEDAVFDMAGPGGTPLPAAVAGYRAPEFDDHIFLAVKMGAQQAAREAPMELNKAAGSGLLNQESFAQAAAERLRTMSRSGGAAQVTMINIRGVKDLMRTMKTSDKHALLSAIGNVLRTYSIGGDTAGQVDDDTFSYAHADNVNPEEVNYEVAETAERFLPGDTVVETRSATLDADGAGMTEDQVAKALIHTMEQFVKTKGKLTHGRLSESLDELMSGAVESVKYIKKVTADRSFDIHFMPVCDLRFGKVRHFEALSRFRDARKAKSTLQFITLAENLDLIQDFDMAVIEKTIALSTAFHEKAWMPLVAVNLSANSLGSDQFVSNLWREVRETPGVEKLIMFELTESADVDDLQRANAVIQQFRQAGFSFSLDDFGSGSASLDYLNALEVDVVKFDGPAVRRACSSKRGSDLLSTMTRMCSSTGIHTVAEMVEDKKMANQVFYCGIDYGQGWFFGKPSPDPMEFEADFIDRTE